MWPPLQTVQLKSVQDCACYWFPPKSKLTLCHIRVAGLVLSSSSLYFCAQTQLDWAENYQHFQLPHGKATGWCQLFQKPFEKAGAWPPDHVPVAACVSAGLCCSLHTEGPFSVSSFLGNSGALSRATSLVNISLATAVLSQQRRLSARDTLAPAASAQGLLCERGLSRPPRPRALHHKSQAWVLPMPRGLSHPSGPFSWDRNVRTRLHAFSGTVSNSGLTALPNCARLPVQGHRGSGSHHGHVGGTAGSEALLPTAPLCSSGSPLLLPPPRSCCTEFQSCCNAE